MTSFRTILITLTTVAGLLLAAAVPVGAAPGGDCLTDQEIQAQIESGQIKSWPKIKKIAGISSYQEVSDVRVCVVAGTPYYNVNIVSPSGEAKKVVLNAVDGGS